MRAYALSAALSFTVFVGLVVATNFGIDALGVYRPQNLEMVRAVSNYVARLRASDVGLLFVAPERSVKIELARQIDADCFVIGSSRAMQIDDMTAPQIFSECRKTANLAVSGGAFEDFVLMAAVLAERPGSSTIYVDASPWMLRRNADTRWTDHRALYDRARIVFGLPMQGSRAPMVDAKLLNLFNADYAMYNIRSALAVWRHASDVSSPGSVVPRDARQATDDDAITLSNGRHVYPRKWAPIAAVAAGGVGDERYKLEQPAIDPLVVAEFETVVRGLTQRGSKVVLLLAPYAPNAMSCTVARLCETLGRVETCVRDLATRFHVGVIGSYDPRASRLTRDDFMDGLHLTTLGLRKLQVIKANPWAAGQSNLDTTGPAGSAPRSCMS
jgi:hypothetical protein